MNKDTGGQAFPRNGHRNGHPEMGEFPTEGMTLRDYFAGQYLTSFQIQGGDMTAEIVAEKCYRMADAMIKERSK